MLLLSLSNKDTVMTTTIAMLRETRPLLDDLVAMKETVWCNPDITSAEEGLRYSGLTRRDVQSAEQRLTRFAPCLKQLFPETAAAEGMIESELVDIPALKAALNQKYGHAVPGRVMLKKDSHLPVAGSVKARGGIYEVLTWAEHLAFRTGLLNPHDDYSKLDSDVARQCFSDYEIAVGSTGNLGLSIGLMGKKLGFRVTVHMSADAKAWKKALLRECGANVIEYQDDYSVAVSHGREAAKHHENTLFVDDEHSRTLFLGYAVAGERLKKQSDEQGIIVDHEHPLFVYLPCGVGGAPGGISFGLKLAFGDNVHCFFAEPTHSPCMFLGVYSGLHDQISVQDIGLDNHTVADGLAVGRASGFVGKTMARLISGYYTQSDETLLSLLGDVWRHENIFLEPSAAASISGPWVTAAESAKSFSAQQLAGATHILWATGGGMVPQAEREALLLQSGQ